MVANKVLTLTTQLNIVTCYKTVFNIINRIWVSLHTLKVIKIIIYMQERLLQINFKKFTYCS